MSDDSSDDEMRTNVLLLKLASLEIDESSVQAGPSNSLLQIPQLDLSSGTTPKTQITKLNIVEELLEVFVTTAEMAPYLEVLRENIIYQATRLASNSSRYSTASSKFRESGEIRVVQIRGRGTFRYKLKIRWIERIVNPYFKVHLELKKIKKQQIYAACREKWVFHGTSPLYVEEICRENFNWRLGGTHVGAKFGRGMSFSPKATYASDYPHNDATERTMFLATVINSPSSCVGSQFMTLPREGTDHSIRPNGDVIVKYEDADYNPEYVVYYSRVTILTNEL